ncbi:MAG: type II secretion system protein GspN [Bdellovibrionia bacterium]
MDDTLLPMDTPSSESELAAQSFGTSGETSGSDLPPGDTPPSRLKRILKTLGWLSLGTFCLLFFTLLKLPEDKIRNYVQGMISSQLSSQGITLNANQSSLSIGFGVSYTMKDITLSFPPPQEPIHIDQVSVSPSILSAFLGKMGATIEVENKGGTLHASFSTPMNGPNGPVSFSFNCSNLDLGSLGVLPAMANVRGSAVANGEGHIDGDTSLPTTLNGKFKLDLSKIVIDQQTLFGFSIPRLTVSEGKGDIDVNGGKALIKTLRLGKPGSTTDDIRANVTGDVVIGKNLPYSTLNIKTDFSLSQNVLKAFVLLDAILGPAKKADGSYSYTINGPLNSPNVVPMGDTAPAPAPQAAPNAAPGTPADMQPSNPNGGR